MGIQVEFWTFRVELTIQTVLLDQILICFKKISIFAFVSHFLSLNLTIKNENKNSDNFDIWPTLVNDPWGR